LSWNHGYGKTICEFDSLVAISLIKNGDSGFHPYVAILARIFVSGLGHCLEAYLP